MAAVQEGVRGRFGGNGLESPFYGCEARRGIGCGVVRWGDETLTRILCRLAKDLKL